MLIKIILNVTVVQLKGLRSLMFRYNVKSVVSFSEIHVSELTFFDDMFSLIFDSQSCESICRLFRNRPKFIRTCFTAARIRYHILMLIILNVTVVRLKGLRSLMFKCNVKSVVTFGEIHVNYPFFMACFRLFLIRKVANQFDV